jgi:hypothetical protein
VLKPGGIHENPELQLKGNAMKRSHPGLAPRPVLLLMTLAAAAFGGPRLCAEDLDAPGGESPHVYRINCGYDKEHTDEEGNVWEPDTKYFGTDPNKDGRTVNRGDMEITYTTIPSIYRTERYFFPPDGRNMFSYPLLNGKYLVRLHFVETLGVNRGMRMQKMIIEGQETEVIDIVRAAGGVRMAVTRDYEVKIEDGELNIRFQQTAHDSALINGIEIFQVKE